MFILVVDVGLPTILTPLSAFTQYYLGLRSERPGRLGVER